MPSNVTVYAGTIGQSVWRSSDGGETWERLRDQLFAECDVRALAVHPRSPHIMYAGTEMGCYRTDDGGDHWTRLDSEMNRTPIWALAIQPNSTIWNFATNPADPSLLFAYSISGQVFRSTDGGAAWTKLRREFGEIRAMVWV